MPAKFSIFHWVAATLKIKILCLFFLIALVWWLSILITNSHDTFANNTYGLILGSIPLLGGLFGISLARQWGSLKSALGKAIIFLSVGLVSWSIGTLIFAGYYNLYAEVDVPYPSWADVAYILSLPFWTVGIIYLSKATGAKFGMRSSGGRLILLILPLIIVALSYYLLVIVARGGEIDTSDSELLKIFFDFAYPVGDVLILTVATLVYSLSYNYFGGKFKKAIQLILFGFVLLYIADFSFSYTTTLETFYVGNWVDFSFAIAMFILSLGINLLDNNIVLSKNNS